MDKFKRLDTAKEKNSKLKNKRKYLEQITKKQWYKIQKKRENKIQENIVRIIEEEKENVPKGYLKLFS